MKIGDKVRFIGEEEDYLEEFRPNLKKIGEVMALDIYANDDLPIKVCWEKLNKTSSTAMRFFSWHSWHELELVSNDSSFNLITIQRYIQDHIAWSKQTFGPGRHTEGLCKHITKELDEIRQAPLELEEWIDVMILAIDGAWRAGYSPKAISNALHEKQQINKNRLWGPVVSEDEPIEHVRSLAGVLGEK